MSEVRSFFKVENPAVGDGFVNYVPFQFATTAGGVVEIFIRSLPFTADFDLPFLATAEARMPECEKRGRVEKSSPTPGMARNQGRFFSDAS
ncbi:Hypothetical protein NTJ_07005 [Nesidiocoris tenuis]|uniref:Uncharacterized protein n=1 Tax=Nesidiocoris tenuis TaxID=355587 RepID=A0ABN7APP9_9HEMI|nr:Hypothetical protein NTJ_07005 [Nesidiocoris tenuis]